MYVANLKRLLDIFMLIMFLWLRQKTWSLIIMMQRVAITRPSPYIIDSIYWDACLCCCCCWTYMRKLQVPNSSAGRLTKCRVLYRRYINFSSLWIQKKHVLPTSNNTLSYHTYTIRLCYSPNLILGGSGVVHAHDCFPAFLAGKHPNWMMISL